MKSDDTQRLLAFFRGEGTDHQGRTLAQIVSKSDDWLEKTHDYIQWLFPLGEPSNFNPDAPLLTEEFRQIAIDPAHPDQKLIQKNLTKGLRRMLAFYGYSVPLLSPDEVAGTADWQEQSQHWLTQGNHNQLRLTRILRCLCLLGRKPLAESLYLAISSVGHRHPEVVSERTLNFWATAVSGRIPTDD